MAVVLFILCIILIILYIKKSKEVGKEKKEYEKNKDSYNKELAELRDSINIINNELANKHKEIEALEVKEDLALFDLYVNQFDFDGSEKYKALLDKNIEKQKELRKDKNAIISTTEWSVGGSKAEGKKMTNNIIKLMSMAFDGECDVLMTKVKFNNVIKFEEKIRKEFEIINKASSTTHCEITNNYLNLKLEQLKIYHEYQEKLQEEKEEQRYIKEMMREEEKARKEAEKAKLQAEKEEKMYLDALEKAKADLQNATEEEKSKMNEEIEKLQKLLEEANQNKERAKSMAELTKRGHVYIISNIGSFGENVYKIGMTRRLEPLDRVKELSSASVPFDFDIHAIIPSDDAPGLENKLHKIFNQFRLNKVNERKEYFKVQLDDVEKELKKENIEYKLTKIAEAKDYRETLMLLKNINQNIN